MNRWYDAIHRWTSLAAILQLGVWTATGLLFALVPLQRTRGEWIVRAQRALRRRASPRES